MALTRERGNLLEIRQRIAGLTKGSRIEQFRFGRQGDESPEVIRCRKGLGKDMMANIRTLGTCCLTSIALVATSSTAIAGDDAPVLEVDWTVDGTSDAGSLTGEGLGAGIYLYTASTVGEGFEINWSFTVTDNGASGGFEILASALGFTNTSSDDSNFEIAVSLPVMLNPGNAFYGGSVAGSLTGDDGGGYLASMGDSALYNAYVDGEGIASLVEAPFELTTDPFGSADLVAEAFGDPIPSLEALAAQESMSIGLNFMLGAGDSFAVTSNYVAQVPAPGALALLGIAGGFNRRRRRA